MKRFSRLALVLIAGLLTLSGLQFAPTAAQDNTLVMARATDATGLDPHTQTAFASLRLLELIYEPLLTVNENLELTPVLAESWEFSRTASSSPSICARTSIPRRFRLHLRGCDRVLRAYPR